MDKQGFREFLKTRHLADDDIAASIAIVERFAEYLAGLEPALTLETAIEPAALEFIAGLIDSKENTHLNLLALARYGYHIRNDELYAGVLALLDGAEVMDNFYAKLADVLGTEERDAVFGGVTPPPLGTPSREKARLMREVMGRLEARVEPAVYRKVLSGCLRDLSVEWFMEDKKKYDACAGLDEYLKLANDDFIAMLEKIRADDTVFFNQRITPEVIEYVKANPEVGRVVRRGNKLYQTKIPFLAHEYLQETDPDKQRYLYCHCPWARESLKDKDGLVSSEFCYCSGGFTKKRWEVIFGQELEVELLQSVLRGDLTCRFAITLPEGL
ncbi:hypothetical protein JW859_04095 [bacterium]|nr:hypothetical protein [bacterium]